MQRVDLSIYIEVYANASELSVEDQALLAESHQATQQAYAPYSHFHVGAALRLEDGTIVKGSNQENAAYPSGLCAERTAIFWAASNHPGKTIRAIAVAACHEGGSDFLSVSPCGSCRQAMLEYETRQGSPIRLLINGAGSEVWVSPSISNLLPMKFDEKSLLRE